MPTIDAPKLNERINAFRISLFTLAALLETTEPELKDLIAGKLDDERAEALRHEIEAVLHLEENALLLDCKIPDARARKAVGQKLRAARKALGSALESCRAGNGKGYCETMKQQLADLDQLEQELEGKVVQADDADDDS